MKKTIQLIVDDLHSELQKVKQQNLPILKLCDCSVGCIHNCLNHLRRCLRAHAFPSPDDEIIFFKKIKPSVLSQLFYFVEVYKIELDNPYWSITDSKEFLLSHQNRINIFRARHKEFYHYIRNDLTNFDDRYFLRYKLSICNVVDSLSYDVDPDFTTGMDFLVARLLADDLILDFLCQKLFDLSENEFSPPSAFKPLRWTESKIALTELIYAIHAAECFNDGQIDIKDIARYFQTAFHVQLGDFYRDFNQIKNRVNTTRFIDCLKEAICSKIES